MKRQRNFNITINESADCYETIEKSLVEQQKCFYALIVHDKDKINENEPKKVHKHVVISFENARAFESVQKMFEGAHIEDVIDLAKSIQYLTHKNDSNKYQYDTTEIITNNAERLQELYDSNNKIYPTLTEDVIEDIFAHGEPYMRNVIYFYHNYGNDQVKRFRQMILDYMKCYNDYTLQATTFETQRQQEEELDKILPF